MQRISARTAKHKQFPWPAQTRSTIFMLLTLAIAALPTTVCADAVFFLARHAEKQAEGDDPGLDEAGRARAGELADMLADTGLTSIYSTDFRRTRETAQAVATRLGLAVRLYDPAEPGPLLDALRQAGGRYLLVGHSNTVPELADRLGGEPFEPIDEEGEYDRLYVVTVDNAGDASTVLLRYGDRFGR